MASVTLTELTKRYGAQERPAVEAVSLEAADGELLVLVGPSGCGKSTTLRMIAGLETVTAGEIRIGERVVNDVGPAQRDIAMVFQNYALYPHMTVYRNMAFGLMLRKEPKAEIDRRVREAAATLGLTPYLDRKPKALSGGQRQRVAVGRAIVRQPQVFLFDEPLSNLDAAMRGEMRAELKRLHQQLGATMIYVTHDQTEAMTLGDRIAVMHEGRVQQIDAPMKIYDEPANRFVAGFVGSPAMNFIEGKIAEGDGDEVWFEAAGTRVRVTGQAAEALRGSAGREVTLGVRPEHLRIASGGEGAIRGRVELVEPMGAETHVHVQAEGVGTMIARLGAQTGAATGEAIELAFEVDRARWFDTASGERSDSTQATSALD